MIVRGNRRASGAVAVETAIVLPIVCLLVIAILVGGMDVLRHQQLACLSREGARWASVRGADYQGDTNQSSPTQQQITDLAVVPLAAGMDPAALTVKVEWVDKGSNSVQDWDSSTKAVRSITTTGEYVTNAVRVTVTYQITADVFGEPLTLQSVSELPMMN